MLSYLVYYSLDIIFGILFWTTKKTFSGISMLYYYYYDIDYEEKKNIDINKLQEQINNQTKLIEELNNKIKNN